MQALIIAREGSQPLRTVAGMSLLKRNLLTVRHASVEHVTVLCDEAEQRAAIANEHPDLSVASSADLDEHLNDDAEVLVLSASRVHDKGLGSCFESAEPTPSRGYALVGPHSDDGSPLLVHVSCIDEGAELAQEGPAALRASLGLQGLLSEIQTGERFIDQEVIDDDSAVVATEALWQSCRKPLDGIVSTSLNRYLSLFVSRRIVDTRIHPNHISILCILLGIGSGIATLGGTYWWILLGAVLLKLNSIIDGVDGELARVRWQFSRTGELLDSAGDNVSNFSFYGALTWVMFQQGARFYGWVGVAMLTMWSIHLIWVYSRLARMGRGDVLIVRSNVDEVSGSFGQRLVDFFRYRVLRRDSFVMLTLIFMALGWHGPMLVVMACGAAALFGNVVVHYIIALQRWISRDADSNLVEEPVKEG